MQSLPAGRVVYRKCILWPIVLCFFWMVGLSGTLSAQQYLNFNFGSGAKTGQAATGSGASDLWNLVPRATNVAATYTYYGSSYTVPTVTWGMLTNLIWANSNSSTAWITITNLTSVTANGASDAMLNSYLTSGAWLVQDYYYNEETMEDVYVDIFANPRVVIHNLPAGTYDLLLYGVGSYGYDSYDNETFQIKVGTNAASGYKATANLTDLDVAWAEDQQYVRYTNLVVQSGDTITISLNGNYDYYYVINGLQLVAPAPVLPNVTFDPASGTTVPTEVSLTVAGHSGASIYYTLDGTTPTTSSTLYSNAISLTAATTVKAFATQSGYQDSSVTSATYPLPQLPDVTFSPSGGASLPTNITLSVPGHTNATIYYTVDGTLPTTNGVLYTGSITLAADDWSYTDNFVPTMTGYTTPSGNTVTYSSELASSQFYGWRAFDHSTASGNTSAWCANSGSSEWVAIQFPSTRRVAKYAIISRAGSGDGPKSWTLEGWNGSSYVVLDTRSNETDWLPSERREFVCTNSAAFIKYRLNVSEGNASAANSTGKIMVGEIEMMEAKITVMAYATKSGYLDTSITASDYYATASTIPQVVPTPRLSPAGGSFNNNQSVTISCALSGATIEYCTNGVNWVSYSSPVVLDRSTTLQTRASKSGYANSLVGSGDFGFAVAASSILPAGGTFTNTITVILTNATAGATIQYKTNGSSLVTYSSSFELSADAELVVVASKTYFTSSTNGATFIFRAPSATNYLNLNFGSGSKVGIAAVGETTNDSWNLITAATNVVSTYTYYGTSTTVPVVRTGSFSNLVWHSGVASPVAVTVTNLTSVSANGHADAMFNSFLWSSDILVFDWNEDLQDYVVITGNPSVVIEGLPAGTYDFLIYGLGPSYDDNSGYRLLVGTNSPTSWKYTYQSGEIPEGFQEDVHYVRFTNLTVSANARVKLEIYGNYNYTDLLNGMQIVQVALAPPPQLPAVSFSPATGATVPVDVTLSVSGHGDASIFYTLDGSTPTTSSTGYSGAVSLSAATTVKAIATKSGYSQSSVSSASYVLPTAPVPTVSPANGTFSNAVSVTISSDLSGASYQYSYDGSTWTDYSGAVTVNGSATFYARTLKSGYNTSSSTNRTYAFRVATTQFDPNGGVFTNSVQVKLTNVTAGATLHYKINGGSSTLYEGPFFVTNTVLVTAIADHDNYGSTTNSVAFTLSCFSTNSQALFNVNFGSGTKVGLAATGNATNDLWNVIGPAASATATNLIWADSSGSGVTVTVANLPDSGSISGHPDVMLASYISGPNYDSDLAADINGSLVISNFPPGNYSVYLYGVGADPEALHETFQLSVGTNTWAAKGTRADSYDVLTEPWTEDWQYVVFTNVVVATDRNLVVSLVGGLTTHVLNGMQIVGRANISSLPALPAVTFDPPDGAHVPVEVALTVSGYEDATIYFTTNGTVPTTSSAVYSAPIALNAMGIIKAIAIKEGYADAPLASAQYWPSVLPPPDVSPGGGTYPNDLSVVLSGSLAGATLRYSTNGTSWVTYTVPIAVTTNTVILAKASRSDYETDSVMVTNAYDFAVADTVVLPHDGNFTNAISVTLANETRDAVIDYWWNGDGPIRYGGTFILTASGSLTAVAQKPGYAPATNAFTFNRIIGNSPVAGRYLNLNFGAGTRVGTAVVGQGLGDQWNLVPAATNVAKTYTYSDLSQTVPIVTWGMITNLVFSDGRPSSVTVSITNLTQTVSAAAPAGDAMMSSYLASDLILVSDVDTNTHQPFTITADPRIRLRNLPAGTYDFYIYGLGSNYVNATQNDNEAYRLKVGTQLPTAWKHTVHPGAVDTNWVENQQYVVFSSITINSGEDVLISLGGNQDYRYLINGMQLVNHSAALLLPQLPEVAFTPPSGSILPVNLELSVPGNSGATIYYTTNGAPPTTNSSIYSSPIALGTNAWGFSTNIVPNMVDYTDGKGAVVTYSSELASDEYGTYEAWKAFYHYFATAYDIFGQPYQYEADTDYDFWSAAGSTNEWVAIDLGSPRRIAKYTIAAPAMRGEGPQAWIMEAWNGTGYVTLDSHANEGDWQPNQKRDYVCTTTGYYQKYRWRILAGNASADNPDARIIIGQLELAEAVAYVNAFATKSGYLPSNDSAAKYFPPDAWIIPSTPAPVITPASDWYGEPITVSITSALPSALYRYSTNGSRWYTNSTFFLNHDSEVSAQTIKSGFHDGPITVNTYHFSGLESPDPGVYPPGGTYRQSIEVSIFGALAGGGYRYSVNNGATWVTNNALVLGTNVTLIAQTFKTGYSSSHYSTNTYVFDGGLPGIQTGLLNINFGLGTKVGFAGGGYSATDVWNTVTSTNSFNSILAPITNLVWADAVTAGVGMRMTGLTNRSGNGNGDAMLGSFLTGSAYDPDVGELPAVIRIMNLPTGTYDLYCYGIGNNSMYERSGFKVTSGGYTNGYLWTNPDGVDFPPDSTPLEYPLQYVVFTNIPVSAAQSLSIQLQADYSSYTYIINGLQLVCRTGGLPQAPPPGVTPSAGVYSELTTVTFTNVLPGANYRYSTNGGGTWYEGTNVTLLHHATLLLQSFKLGFRDSDIVTNAYTINLPVAPSPAMFPPPDGYPNAIEARIYSSLPGAGYRYSTNGGSTWVTNNLLTINLSSTVLAQTFKYGYSNSVVSTNGYVIDSGLPSVNATLLNLNFGGGLKTGYAATGLSTNDAWNLVTTTNSIASMTTPLTNFVWANGTNSSVGLELLNLTNRSGNGNADALLGNFLTGPVYLEGVGSLPASLKVLNLPPGTYDFYAYAIGGSSTTDRGGFQLVIGGQTNAWQWTNPDVTDFPTDSTALEYPLQYVVFTNLVVGGGQSVVINLAADGSSYNYFVNGLQVFCRDNGLPKAPAPTVTPGGGSYDGMRTVAFSSWMSGLSFRYSTNNGSTWFTNSQVDLLHSAVLLSQSFKSGFSLSDTVTNSYTISLPSVPGVQLYPIPGEYAVPVEVAVFSELAGASYRLSTDAGAHWQTNVTIVVSNSVNLVVQGFKYGYFDGPVSTNSYVINASLTNRVPNLLNFNFGVGTKDGIAGNGYSSTDAWNTVTSTSSWHSLTVPITNLVWADGSQSGVGAVIVGLTNSSGNGNADAMLGSFLTGPTYDSGFGELPARIRLMNLPAGNYDLFGYAIGNSTPYDRGAFQVVSGSQTNDWQWTNPGQQDFDVTSVPLRRGLQYVVVTNLTVSSAQSVWINLRSDQYTYILNGMQLVPSGTGMSVAPPPTFIPLQTVYTNATSIIVTGSLAGATYQISSNAVDWAEYTGEISLDGTVTLFAQTFKSGYLESDVVSYKFQFEVLPVLVVTSPGTNAGTVHVELSDLTQGAVLQYSLNGSSFTNYSGPFEIPVATMLTSIATKSGYTGATNVTFVIDPSEAGRLLNLNFGGGTRTGWAATGISSEDIWNAIMPATNVATTYLYSDGVTTVPILQWGQTTNLFWSDGASADVTVTITNLIAIGTNGAISDQMLRTYLMSDYYLVYDVGSLQTNIIRSDPKVVISNLPAKSYDIYLYAVGANLGDDDGFSVTIGANTPSATKYTSQLGTIASQWIEGQQYVVFHNLAVGEGENVTIQFNGNYNYTTLINGLQIAENPLPHAPAPIFIPPGGYYQNAIQVVVTNLLPGATTKVSTNGVTWSTFSTPILLYSDITLRAKTVKAGFQDSSVAIATYTFPGSVAVPTVAFTGLTNGQVIPAPTNLVVNVDAVDPDGVVTNVVLFTNNVVAGSDAQSPFTFILPNCLGQLTLRAEAVDNDGHTNSASIGVVLDIPPTVQILSPTNGSLILTPYELLVEVAAADTDGTITSGELLVDGVPVGVPLSTDGFLEWTEPPGGDHQLRVKVQDNWGLCTTSAPVQVSIYDAIPILQIVRGNWQVGLPGQRLPVPLTVSVKNYNGTPQINCNVTFTLTDGDARILDPATGQWGTNVARVTDASGTAWVWARLSSTTNLLNIVEASSGLGTTPATVRFSFAPSLLAGGTSTNATNFAGMVIAVAANDQLFQLLADGRVYESGPRGTRFVPNLSNVVAVSASMVVNGETGHELFLKDDGTVWARGRNSFGQLGIGSYTATNAVTQIAGLSRVVNVSAGPFHSSAVRADGSVWVWGDNGYGQLGDGAALTNSPVPVQVAGVGNAVNVAAGAYHSLALSASGDVVSWGHTGTRIKNVRTMARSLGWESGAFEYTIDWIHEMEDGSIITTQVEFYSSTMLETATLEYQASIFGTYAELTAAKLAHRPEIVFTNAAVGIAAGYGSSYAVEQSGAVAAWGSPWGYQLGVSDGSTFGWDTGGNADTLGISVQSGPILGSVAPSITVPGVSNVISVIAGPLYAIAVTSSGEIWAWGEGLGLTVPQRIDAPTAYAIAGGGVAVFGQSPTRGFATVSPVGWVLYVDGDVDRLFDSHTLGPIVLGGNAGTSLQGGSSDLEVFTPLEP